MIEFLKTGNNNLITRYNNARETIKDITYCDVYELLAKYSLMYFIINQLPVTLTEEMVNINTNDLEGKIKFTEHDAIETFAIINAINPFVGYNSMACSKNMKAKICEMFINERYGQNKIYDFNDDFAHLYAKFIKTSKNKVTTQYYTSIERLNNCIREIKEQENIDDVYVK